MDDILSRLEQMLGWVPEWMLGTCLVVGAILVALLATVSPQDHQTGAQHALAGVDSAAERVAGPARLAICLVAVALVLPLAPLNDILRNQLGTLSSSPSSG